jgi:hypothetical protein
VSVLNLPNLSGLVSGLSGPDSQKLQAGARAQDKFNLDTSNAIAPAVSPVAWTSLALANGWILYNAGNTSPAYFKDATGRVWLKGTIKGGTAGVNLFSQALPAPSVGWTLACITDSGVGYVDINTNGSAVLGSGGGGWLSLDSLSYVP